MRLKEQRLWDTFKRNAPAGFWLQRIENMVGEGMPDVVSRNERGGWGWIELKAPTAPKRITTRLLGAEGLNTAQISWHVKAATKGGPNYVLIRDDHKRIYLIDCVGLHEAGGLLRINDLTASEIEFHSVASTWPEVFGVLNEN